MNTNRRPRGVDFKRVQAHYDLSDRFFALFLDSSMTYSCAKFDTPQASLADAQVAKIDLSLGKCELRPGHRLLDIGCGWGSTAMRAAEHYGVDVIGLTISQNQFAHDAQLAEAWARLQDAAADAGGNGASATRLDGANAAGDGGSGKRADGADAAGSGASAKPADGADAGGARRVPRVEFRLQGWESFDEPVDRIVSIGAFEHFGRPKYAEFFARCRAILPPDGVMLLHTITHGRPNDDWDFLRFVHFIATEIFPGGDVPEPELVIASARKAGFDPVHVESLRPHYAMTLDRWASNLAARRDDAVAIAGERTYETYMKYLTGCAALFRSGECNVHQFKLRVIP